MDFMEIKGAKFVNDQARYLDEQRAFNISNNLGFKINQSKEDMQKKIKRRRFVITTTCVVLLTVGTTFALVKAQQLTPIQHIVREAEIHSNHGLTPDGHAINPNLDHDCVIEEKGLAEYARENGFNEVQIQRMMEFYKQLKDKEIGNGQFEEAMNKISKR